MEPVKHHLCSDAELVDLLKKGDKIALKEVYDRYWYALYTQAFNLVSNEDAAKDVVQELYISLWEKISEKEIDDLKAYLFQALKFRSFMLLRKRYTSQKHLDRIKAISSKWEYATEQAVNLSETDQLIKESVSKLPRRCREVFELSRFEHFTNEQIAERMDISVKTVENQMTKAIKLLRAALKDVTILVAFSGWLLTFG